MILFKGKNINDLTSYIKNTLILKSTLTKSISFENKNVYYLIHYKFWEDLLKYLSINENNNKENNNHNQIKKPEINTSKLLDDNCILLPGLEYEKDFILLDSILYNLFKFWFKVDELEIKRYSVINPKANKCKNKIR